MPRKTGRAKDPALPDFRNPPVEEVALAVSFDPIPGLRFAELAGLWQTTFASKFPNIEEQGRFQVPIERFGAPGTPVFPAFQILQAPPLPRLWMVDKTGIELLQVQNDWFARNWRRMGGSAPYPHYSNLKPSFATDLGLFAKFIAERKLGEMRPSQGEVTYINHIAETDLARVLTVLRGRRSGDFLPNPEHASYNSQFVITQGADPVGRLQVSVEPATRNSDGVKITVLTLTARGNPVGPGIEGLIEFLDLGHEWLVRAFDSLTTPEMQQKWGRLNAD